jgi:hypothetical protein
LQQIGLGAAILILFKMCGRGGTGGQALGRLQHLVSRLSRPLLAAIG